MIMFYVPYSSLVFVLNLQADPHELCFSAIFVMIAIISILRSSMVALQQRQKSDRVREVSNATSPTSADT